MKQETVEIEDDKKCVFQSYAIPLILEEEHKITKWLKENGYTIDDCIGAGFEPIEEHQGRAMEFEYNGNVEELDVDKLATAIAENVIDERFSVRISTYGEEEYRNTFCVEIWLNE